MQSVRCRGRMESRICAVSMSDYKGSTGRHLPTRLGCRFRSERDAIPKATPNPRMVLALSIHTPRARMRGMTHMSQLYHQQRIASSSHQSTVDVRSVRSCPCTIPNPPRSPPLTHPLPKHHDKSRNPPRSAAFAHEQHHMNYTQNVRPNRCDKRRT